MVEVAIAALLPVLAADDVLPEQYDHALTMGVGAPATGFVIAEVPTNPA